MKDMHSFSLKSTRRPARRFMKVSRPIIVAAVLLLTVTTVVFAAEKVSEQRQTLITYCLKFMGKPYQSGATGPDSFDCSGFVFTMVHDSLGIQFPRTAQAMFDFEKVEHISPTVREPGDLVFFKSLDTGKINHVGIYVGKRKFIHSASDGPNTGIIISTLDENYWKNHYAGSGRFLPTTKEAKAAETNPEK
jgi:cell wall-associated NlpC family hydrolase